VYTLSENPDARERIIHAAATALAGGDVAAVSARRIARTAGVQSPVIYRLFGDMQGLLEAAVAYGFTDYLQNSPIPEGEVDAISELRRAWDMHIEFGLANPGIYKLMYGNPLPGVQAEHMRSIREVLAQRVSNVARAGLLAVDVDHAVLLAESVGTGVVMSLIGMLPEERDLTLSITCREMTLQAITVPGTADGQTDHVGSPLTTAALTISASLSELSGTLTPGELGMLGELLARISRSA
jgi:AcrR family transcriptional regulator